MREKIIVKAHWLSFLQVPRKLQTQLQTLILSGKLANEKNIPQEILRQLSVEEVSFLLEKTHQVLGRPSLLLRSLEELSQTPPAQKTSLRLWQERAFLKGFAFSRLGRTAEASRWFQLLPPNFFGKVSTEYALVQLNQGDFMAAEAQFKKALANTETEFDPYSICTLLGGLSLASIQQGSFKQAMLTLRRRRRILYEHPSAALEFGTRLYEILLLLEQNDFEAAQELLRGSLDEQSSDSINGFFLYHLKLRLHLARNELSEALAVLEHFKSLMDSQKLPQGVLDFRLEEIEWNLRAKNPEEALLGIQRLESEPQSRIDHYLQFRLSLLKAQANYQQGHIQNAYQEITQVVQQGERRHYLPGLTWALFHGAGISLAAGHPVQAKLFIHRGERVASDLGLGVRFACFSYIGEVMDQQQMSGNALLSLVRRQEIGPEMEYYLGSYSLLSHIALTVSSRRGQEVVTESDLRRQLFQESGLFWFQKEEVLLANFGNYQTKFADLSHKPHLLAAFRLFWNAYQNLEKGFSLKDIHQTRHSSTYREELHAGGTKMLLTRLREALQSCGLKVSYNRDEGLYSLQSQLSPYTLLSRTEQPTGHKHHRNREEELLSRIAMEPFVPTRVLCHEFNVSRQALHPFLHNLVSTKKIRLVKRGPISGYIFVSK